MFGALGRHIVIVRPQGITHPLSSIMASAALRLPCPPAGVRQALTIRPARFSIQRMAEEGQLRLAPRALATSRASGSVIEAKVSFERRGESHNTRDCWQPGVPH
jgi:hypothetical protein